MKPLATIVTIAVLTCCTTHAQAQFGFVDDLVKSVEKVVKPPRQRPVRPPNFKPLPVKPPIFKPLPIKPPIFKPLPIRPPVYKPLPIKPPVFKPLPIRPPVIRPRPIGPPVIRPVKPPIYRPLPYRPRPVETRPRPGVKPPIQIRPRPTNPKPIFTIPSQDFLKGKVKSPVRIRPNPLRGSTNIQVVPTPKKTFGGRVSSGGISKVVRPSTKGTSKIRIGKRTQPSGIQGVLNDVGNVASAIGNGAIKTVTPKIDHLKGASLEDQIVGGFASGVQLGNKFAGKSSIAGTAVGALHEASDSIEDPNLRTFSKAFTGTISLGLDTIDPIHHISNAVAKNPKTVTDPLNRKISTIKNLPNASVEDWASLIEMENQVRIIQNPQDATLEDLLTIGDRTTHANIKKEATKQWIGDVSDLLSGK